MSGPQDYWVVRSIGQRAAPAVVMVRSRCRGLEKGKNAPVGGIVGLFGAGQCFYKHVLLGEQRVRAVSGVQPSKNVFELGYFLGHLAAA